MEERELAGRPPGAGGMDRRGHARHPRPELRVSGAMGSLRDVSLGGCGLILPAPTARGARLRLLLEDESGQSAQWLAAEVAWAAGNRAGLRWLGLSSSQRFWLYSRVGQGPVSRETLFLAALSTLDMLSTAWLLHHGLAVEANPLLRGVAESGLGPFVSVKTLSYIPALAAAEVYRRRRPEFVLPLLRIAGGLYVTIYTGLTLPQILR